MADRDVCSVCKKPVLGHTFYTDKGGLVYHPACFMARGEPKVRRGGGKGRTKGKGV